MKESIKNYIIDQKKEKDPHFKCDTIRISSKTAFELTQLPYKEIGTCEMQKQGFDYFKTNKLLGYNVEIDDDMNEDEIEFL